MEDSDSPDRDVVQALEYAEDRLAKAEDAIWNIESDQMSTAQQQTLNGLSEALWAVQNRLSELKDDCGD